MSGGLEPTRPDIPAADDVVLRWTNGESVIVEGIAHSFHAHAAALRAAWEVPGVRCVDDRVEIHIRPA
jgi:osmotically-inducible protein OsmY